jgi:hypothetical protein
MPMVVQSFYGCYDAEPRMQSRESMVEQCSRSVKKVISYATFVASQCGLG